MEQKEQTNGKSGKLNVIPKVVGDLDDKLAKYHLSLIDYDQECFVTAV